MRKRTRFKCPRRRREAPRSLPRSFFLGNSAWRKEECRRRRLPQIEGKKYRVSQEGDKKLSENCGIVVHLPTKKNCVREISSCQTRTDGHDHKAWLSQSARHKHPLSAVTFQNITPLRYVCHRAKTFIKHADVRSLTRRMSPRESGAHRALHPFPLHIRWSPNTYICASLLHMC